MLELPVEGHEVLGPRSLTEVQGVGEVLEAFGEEGDGSLDDGASLELHAFESCQGFEHPDDVGAGKLVDGFKDPDELEHDRSGYEDQLLGGEEFGDTGGLDLIVGHEEPHEDVGVDDDHGLLALCRSMLATPWFMSSTLLAGP
jgi:hypothetical protein